MNRELLEKPFDSSQIKQREGAFGDVLDYIEGVLVIQRLNDALNGDWTFEVLDHHVYDLEVVVLGRLNIAGVSKSQFGKSKITRTREGKALVSLGDDLKAAATDSLKKCATLFGVGLHLYFDQPYNEASSRNGEARPNGGDNGAGDTNGRLSAKQLSAIFALAKMRGWSNKDVREFTQEMFSKMPDFLSRKEASAVIQPCKEPTMIKETTVTKNWASMLRIWADLMKRVFEHPTNYIARSRNIRPRPDYPSLSSTLWPRNRFRGWTTTMG